jgi:hypothetical protein
MDLSINTARPDIARVEPPVSAPPLKPRTLTVSDGPHGAALRLQGRWLEQAGFAVGTRVHVQVSTGRLIVNVIEEALGTSGDAPRCVHDTPPAAGYGHRPRRTRRW